MKKDKIIKKELKIQSDYSDFSVKKYFKYINPVGVRDPLKLLDFINWSAIPKGLKSPKTQREFALKFGLDEDTLTKWKTIPLFWDEVSRIRGNNFRRFTSDIYYALVKKALTGNVPAIKLFAQLFEGFSESISVRKQSVSAVVTNTVTDQQKKEVDRLLRLGYLAIVEYNKQ